MRSVDVESNHLKFHVIPMVTALILLLAQQHPQKIAEIEDGVGAKILHCLALANSGESISLLKALVKQDAHLLLGVHGQHSEKPKPVFFGEGTLHIVAVNKNEGA